MVIVMRLLFALCVLSATALAEPLNVLFIDPDALPFLWSVVAPQPELASAPIRGSVPVASDTAAIPRRDG